MVFLRTKVVRNATAADELLDDVYKRAPALKKWDQDSGPKRRS